MWEWMGPGTGVGTWRRGRGWDVEERGRAGCKDPLGPEAPL